MKCRTMISILAAACLTSPAAPPAWGEIETDTVEYKDGRDELKGYLAYDGAIKGKRPGVLVLHERWGLNDYVKMRARQLAALG